MSVAGTAADAAAAPAVGFVEHDAERHVKRREPERGEVVAELLHARLVAHRRVRVRRARRRLGGIHAALACT